MAAESKNWNAVELFMILDADLNLLSPEQYEHLIKYASISESSKHFQESLYGFFFDAVIENRVEIVKLMAEKGVDIDWKDGSTNVNAVQFAVYENRLEILQILFDNYIMDTSMIDDNNGMNLFQFSVISNNTNLVRFILEYNSYSTVKDLIKTFHKNDQVIFHNPLLQACMNKNVQVAKMLVKSGAQVDLKCHCKFSPINYVMHLANVNENVKNSDQVVDTVQEYEDDGANFNSDSDDSDLDDEDYDSDDSDDDIKNEISLKEVTYYDELFKIFLNEIKCDHRKLQVALSYARKKGVYRYANKIRKAIRQKARNQKKYDAMKRKFSGQYNRSLDEKIREIKFYFDNYKNMNQFELNLFGGARMLNELIKEKDTNILLNLILEHGENGRKFERFTKGIDTNEDLGIWQVVKIIESIIDSPRKHELINLMAKYPKSSIITCSYVYSVLFKDFQQNSFAASLLSNYKLTIRVVAFVLTTLEEKIDIKISDSIVSDRIESILNDWKRKTLSDNDLSVEKMERRIRELDRALGLLERIKSSKTRNPIFGSTFSSDIKRSNMIIRMIKEEYFNRDLNFGEHKQREKFIQTGIGMLKYANSYELFLILENFRLIETSQKGLYERRDFLREALKVSAVYTIELSKEDDRINVNLRMYPEVLDDSPELIRHMEDYKIEDFAKMAREFQFKSSEVFVNFLQQSLDLGIIKRIVDKPFNQKAFKMIVEDEFLIDFFQCNGIKLKFDVKFLKCIEIEDVPESINRIPIFKVPKHLENIEAEDWETLEILTGKRGN